MRDTSFIHLVLIACGIYPLSVVPVHDAEETENQEAVYTFHCLCQYYGINDYLLVIYLANISLYFSIYLEETTIVILLK